MKNQIKILIAVLILAIFNSCETNDMNEPGLLVPLLVTEDPSLPSIYVNGATLHSETFGDPNDPMIVVVHGGPGGDYRAILNCQAFANDGYFVVFYDQIGSGLSERFNADVFTMPLFIDELKGVIEYYQTSPGQDVILMTHSWGSMLGAAYVNEYPAEIDGLILLEPGGLTFDDLMDYISRAQPFSLFSETFSDYAYIDQFITSDEHNALDYKAVLKSGEDERVGDEGPVPFWRYGTVCSIGAWNYADENGLDFTTNLHLYTTKVLFGYSENNDAYGREHAIKVSSAFPNVELVEIKDAGHEIIYWAWDNYYPIALNYLNEITNK